MNKKILKSFKQINGQIATEALTNLDKFTKQEFHKISLASKYQDKLSNMELDDLKDLASEMGLMPLDNRDALIKNIKKEFKKK